MSKVVTNLHCNACDNGIVTLIVKDVKGNIDVSVNGCNVCAKSFGVKSISGLKTVKSMESPLSSFFNHRSDASDLEVSQQEKLENDFNSWYNAN